MKKKLTKSKIINFRVTEKEFKKIEFLSKMGKKKKSSLLRYWLGKSRPDVFTTR